MGLDENAAAAALASENGTAGPFPGVTGAPLPTNTNFAQASDTYYDQLESQLGTLRNQLQSAFNSNDFAQADALL